MKGYKKVLTKLFRYVSIVINSFLLSYYLLVLSIDLYLDMTKRERRDYKINHKLAKFLCAIINTILFVNVLEIDKPILFFLINITYFFGVNTIGYILESIRHKKHKHDII